MRTVRRELNLRKYTYVAYLTEAGKLSYIKAGCRRWKTFTDARAYYNGEGPTARRALFETHVRWSDAWTELQKWHDRRAEATACINRLQIDVGLYVQRMRARKRKKKK